MKYTKKERNAIYRKALELFYRGKRGEYFTTFLCLIFFDVDESLKDEDLSEQLPEFWLFKPRGESYAWWESNDHDNRENALLFCIEMTK